MSPKGPPPIIPTLSVDNVPIFDNVGKANVIADHYDTKWNTQDGPPPLT